MFHSIPIHSVKEIAPFFNVTKGFWYFPHVSGPVISLVWLRPPCFFACLVVWKPFFLIIYSILAEGWKGKMDFWDFLLYAGAASLSSCWKVSLKSSRYIVFLCFFLIIFIQNVAKKSILLASVYQKLVCCALRCLSTHCPPLSVSSGWIHGTVGCTLAQNIMSPVTLQLISQMFPEAGMRIKRLHEWPRQQR